MRWPNLVVHQVPIHIGAVGLIEKVLVDYLDKASAYRNCHSSSAIKPQVSSKFIVDTDKVFTKSHISEESLSSKPQSGYTSDRGSSVLTRGIKVIQACNSIVKIASGCHFCTIYTIAF